MYCPGTEVELPKYFHMEYKGSSSTSWPVQYQYCAGRVKEEVSIPRVEVRDVSLEQDDHEEVSKKEEDEVLVEYKESWSTGLEEVRSAWRSREEEIGQQRLLQTGRMVGERRVSQEFVDLC